MAMMLGAGLDGIERGLAVPPATLSGGQRARASLMRTLLAQPALASLGGRESDRSAWARSEADMLKTAGENAVNNSYGKAASTVLQAGSTYVGSGWIKKSPGGHAQNLGYAPDALPQE